MIRVPTATEYAAPRVRRTYTEADRIDVIARCRTATDHAVSTATGVPKSTIRRWRDDAGITREPNFAYPAETRDEALRLAREGYTIADIAELTGVSRTAISRWRRHAGIKPVVKRAHQRDLILEEDVRLRTVNGESANVIAGALGVSQRTVERIRVRARLNRPTVRQPRDWGDRALCAGLSHVFDRAAENQPDAVAKAKAICGWCPVAADCLAWATAARVDGVLGGTTAGERRARGRAA